MSPSGMEQSHIVIEAVRPSVDSGAFPAKAIAGEPVLVTADIFRDGPELISAVVRYKNKGDRLGGTPSKATGRWAEVPLIHLGNDHWEGTFTPTGIGPWIFEVVAWPDRWATWRRSVKAKLEAGQDISVELDEGLAMLRSRLGSLKGKVAKAIQKAIDAAADVGDAAPGALYPRVAALLDDDLASLLDTHPDRSGATTSKPPMRLMVERERAAVGAWYEMFPRSTGKPGEHGTFVTAAEQLAAIADMGFDVVYLPPIHPIGNTHRKGPNNALEAGPGDVGSPWAIGNEHGGHTEVHPGLGTIAEFDAFVGAAERLGLEVALDFAIQCSPDHPWVGSHPEWFNHRPDGSIKYAENPPKRYQDIYPINFDTEDREGLWNALKAIVDHWIDHGIKIFRVDNPHTKPFAFWEWLIAEVHSAHPDVVFLAEAFTRPKVMNRLGKLGFSQSYTYFTWRNGKQELTEYLEELADPDTRSFFRPNLFVNTPDILHEYLQAGGVPAFKIRLILAAFLSPSYGIYSGYELFERVPAEPGSEEYVNSEKYQLVHRDWDAPGNLRPYITKVNDIRRKHPASLRLENLRWHHIDNDSLMAFSKGSATEGDAILCVVNINPFTWHEGTLHLDLEQLGLDPSQPFRVHDLIGDETYLWNGSANYIRLDPGSEPAHVFRIET